MKLKRGITKLFGIPGSGKSTYQTEHISEGLMYGGIEGNLITSFSRGAVAELLKRNLKGVKLSKEERKHFGTLHSICYHMLGAPQMVESNNHIQEFNDMFPEFALSTTNIDEDTMNTSSHTQGDLLMLKYMDYRSTLKPFDEWENSVKQFHDAWTTFKNGRMDFLGLIEETYKRDLYPDDKIKFMFVDEAQDLVPIEFQLIKKWYQKIPNGIISGDDDQCQPPNTSVLINTNGMASFKQGRDHLVSRRIDLLDESRDTIYCYNQLANKYEFKHFRMKKMFYNNDMVKIHTKNVEADYTIGHKLILNWAVGSNVEFAAYDALKHGQRHGNVGSFLAYNRYGHFMTFICKLFDTQGRFLPTKFAKDYQIISYWLLEYGEDEEEIRKNLPLTDDAEEIAKKFGVYLAFPFWNKYSDTDYSLTSKEFTIPAYYVGKFPPRTFALLFPAYPTSYVAKKIRNPDTMVYSSEFIIDVTKYHYKGYVYGLDVDKNHNYFHSPVVDNFMMKGYKVKNRHILTHNCIYDFKGADPNLLLDFNTDRIEVLDKSHRVPHEILDYSMRWIKQVNRRQPKDYQGNQKRGIINRNRLNYKNSQQLLDQLLIDIKNNKQVMVLASCSYMLDPLKNLLKREGIPFHNPFRTNRYDWNPLRVERKKMPLSRRLYDFLNLQDDDKDLNWDFDTSHLVDPFEDMFEDEDLQIESLKEDPFEDLEQPESAEQLFYDENLMQGKYWFGNQFKNWALHTSKVFKRGSKKMVEKAHDDVKITEQMLKYIFKNQSDIDKALKTDIEWFKHVLKKNAFNEYPFKVYERFGKDALVAEPNIIIGTIYSMKGAEADVVYVFPDLSAKGFKAYQKQPDPVIRLFYVAFTRAKERLELMSPKSYKNVRWIK